MGNMSDPRHVHFNQTYILRIVTVFGAMFAGMMMVQELYGSKQCLLHHNPWEVC